jgi:general secretion pathway protein G
MSNLENDPTSSTSIRPSTVFLIVFLLLGLAIFLLIPPLAGHGWPKIKATIAQIQAFGDALEMFKSDNGYYPAGTNRLNDLVVKPVGASTNWHQYEDKIPLDPWGHPYRYEYPGKHRTNSYDLSSAGPDGKFGTEDDIGNWQSPKH